MNKKTKKNHHTKTPKKTRQEKTHNTNTNDKTKSINDVHTYNK